MQISLLGSLLGLVWYVIPIIVVYLFWEELRDINKNLESIAEELRKRGASS